MVAEENAGCCVALEMSNFPLAGATFEASGLCVLVTHQLQRPHRKGTGILDLG
jgi:hypothetical protein